MASADVEAPTVPPAALAEPESTVPDYLANPNAVLGDTDVLWRYGRAPDYSKTRKVWEESEYAHCPIVPLFRQSISVVPVKTMVSKTKTRSRADRRPALSFNTPPVIRLQLVTRHRCCDSLPHGLPPVTISPELFNSAVDSLHGDHPLQRSA